MNTDYIDLGRVDLKQQTRTSESFGDGDGDGSSSIRLLQLTDLHIFPKACESFLGIPLRDSYDRCLQLIDHLVTTIQPDVIILTGDIVDGRGPWSGKEAVTEAWHDLIPRFHNTPWIYIPGNHDDDHSPWTRMDLLQILKLPGCLQQQQHQQQQPPSFHHTLLLCKGNNNQQRANTTTRVRLHLMDSGGNDPDPKFMYECTPRETVEGFLQFAQQQQQHENSRNVDNDNGAPELVFLHIPTPEYQHLDPVVGSNNLFQAALAGGKIPFPLDKMAWLIRLCKLDRIAGCRRGGGGGGNDSGLFDACVKANRVYHRRIVALFCGHDHHSDAVFYRPDENIFLGYGRSGSMTPPFDWEGKAPNTLQPGARVIQIDADDGTVTTWIETARGREEDSLLDMTHYEPEQSACFPSSGYMNACLWGWDTNSKVLWTDRQF
eukprot:scaffold8605_cov178-Amphora_coffeaeformis.AAC.1